MHCAAWKFCIERDAPLFEPLNDFFDGRPPFLLDSKRTCFLGRHAFHRTLTGEPLPFYLQKVLGDLKVFLSGL